MRLRDIKFAPIIHRDIECLGIDFKQHLRILPQRVLPLGFRCGCIVASNALLDSCVRIKLFRVVFGLVERIPELVDDHT